MKRITIILGILASLAFAAPAVAQTSSADGYGGVAGVIGDGSGGVNGGGNGGDDANGLFEGAGAWDIADVWRGRFVAVERVGEDLRIELAPVDREA